MLLFSCACSDKSVRVYKWQVGDTFSEVGYSPLLGHTYGVNCVTFSPFGTKLASASTDGSTVIWDVKVRCNHHYDIKSRFLYGGVTCRDVGSVLLKLF